MRLLRRYVSGTRYTLIEATDPGQAERLAQELQPDVIVLDVMIPEVDGWELLGRLQTYPATQHIPIIVCTILVQKELALALGAAAYLRKPVSRNDFLTALDRVLSS